MPSIPCKVAITCPGGPQGINTLDADSPVANFSSEAPDQILFGATGFPIYFPENPLGPDITGLDPSVGPVYLAEGCVGPTYSVLSQDDANAQEIRQAYICQQQKRNPEPTLFFNVPQSCNFTCPDGSLFTWTIAAGYVVTGSQIQADTIAKELACSNANGHFMCLSALTGGCVGQIYNQTVSVNAGGAVKLPLGFTVTSGSLPPGLNLAQSTNQAFISGTPSTPGIFQFTLQVTDANGNFFQKQYTLNILGISNISSLPNAVENTFYSFQLMAAGGTAPFTFVLTSGSLPGLTLSSSGLISGTPPYTSATGGVYPFTVAVTDSRGATCSKSSILIVKLRPGPDWTQFTWPIFGFVQNPPNHLASGGASQNAGSGSLSSPDNTFTEQIAPVASSTISYTGPTVTMRCRLIITSAVGNYTIALALWKNGGGAVNIANQTNVAPGTYDKDTVILVGAGDTYQVQGGINDIGPNNNQFATLATQGNVQFSFFIFNV